MPDWFDQPDPDTGERGLRFACTSCGRCCSGPSGFVRFTEDEARRIANRLGVSIRVFMKEYACTVDGRPSLREQPTEHGHDCVFLDRETEPGRALCTVYEDRPQQCRTWPFWPSTIATRSDWVRLKARCPGVHVGDLIPPERVRILRDATC